MVARDDVPEGNTILGLNEFGLMCGMGGSSYGEFGAFCGRVEMTERAHNAAGGAGTRHDGRRVVFERPARMTTSLASVARVCVGLIMGLTKVECAGGDDDDECAMMVHRLEEGAERFVCAILKIFFLLVTSPFCHSPMMPAK